MLDVNVHPGALSFVRIWAHDPVKPDGPSSDGFARLLYAVKMLLHTTAKIIRQSDIEHLVQESSQHIATRLLWNIAAPIALEGFLVAWRWNQFSYIHSSIVDAIEALLRAFDIS